MIITAYDDGTYSLSTSKYAGIVVQGKNFTRYEVGDVDTDRLSDSAYMQTLIAGGKIIDNDYGT